MCFLYPPEEKPAGKKKTHGNEETDKNECVKKMINEVKMFHEIGEIQKKKRRLKKFNLENFEILTKNWGGGTNKFEKLDGGLLDNLAFRPN